MTAECTRTKLRFQGLDGRDVVGRFDGGEITSDAGGVLLREVEQRTRILGRLSECFTDYRDSDRVEHPVEALIKLELTRFRGHIQSRGVRRDPRWQESRDGIRRSSGGRS